MIQEFSSLHGHSHFSLFDGLSTPEENVKAAKEKGLRSIALTDHGTTHGHADLYIAGKKHGVRVVFGTEAYVIHSLKEWNEMKAKAGDQKLDLEKTNAQVLRRKGHLVILACNRKGLSNLYDLVYRAHRDGFYGKPRMDKEMLRECSEGLVATSACMGGVISKAVWDYKDKTISWEDVRKEAMEFDSIFGRGRFFLEIQLNEHPSQVIINEAMVQLSRETGIPLTVTTDFHYSKGEEWEAREVLHMLDWDRTISSMPNRKINAEIKQLFVKSPEEMWRTYEAYGKSHIEEATIIQAFQNTLLIDSLIEDFEPDTHQRLPSLPYRNPFAEMGNRAIAGLKSLGLADREEYKQRLLHELKVIKDKGFQNYFLIVQKMIQQARDEGQMVGAGRGSSAGSLVCYCLGITDLDPVKYKQLMFERFLDPDRKELPDIDVDFEDVDQTKEMLRRTFGVDNVACLSTYGTFQIKGLLKDMGRVYEIDHNEINRINRKIEAELRVLYVNQDKSTIVIKLEDIERVSPTYREFAEKHPEIVQHVAKLYGRNRHIGRHASGVVIGDNLPRETSVFVTTEKDDKGEKKGRIVQVSFTEGIVNKNLSTMGFVKFDVLSIATLKIIHHAARLVARKLGVPEKEILEGLRPHRMDMDDMKVMKRVFWDGTFAGIFQFTNNGIRKLALKVRPDCFDDVSAITSLYRPGPLGSGMDELFVKSKHDPSSVKYDHPLLENILRDTKGCIIYQEQLMRVCNVLGKMSMKDVNAVRKVLLKKDKSKSEEFLKAENERLKALFLKGCAENGLAEDKAEMWWKNLLYFGGYGFNCLTGDTVVVRAGANSVVSPEATIKELWNQQESRTKTGGLTPIAKKMRANGLNILQFDEDGRVRPGRLKKIYKNGRAPVYVVKTTGGRKIRGTSNHRLLTDEGYVRIESLRSGSKLVVMGLREERQKTGPARLGKGKTYDNHGWPEGDRNPCWIDGRMGFFRSAIEIVRMRAGDRCERCGEIGEGKHGLEFAHGLHLEMLHGDYSLYHSPNNIEHLCNSCHKSFDYLKGERKKRWTRGRLSELDTIESVILDGEEDVFDIEMDTIGHNFIANEIVSHNSAHSYSYSVMTMQCAHLATYHPMEWCAAVLTKGQSGDMQDYVSDIVRAGVRVMGVDVNRSQFDHVIEGDAIRLSLLACQGIGPEAAKKIRDGQPYLSFPDFIQRSGVGKTAIQPLILLGAFDSIFPNMKRLEMIYEQYCSNPDYKRKTRSKVKTDPKCWEDFVVLCQTSTADEDYRLHEKVFFENSLLGFSTHGSPWEILERKQKLERFFDGPLPVTDDIFDSEHETIGIPVVMRGFKEKPQRNKQLMSFMKFGTHDGQEFEAPCFSTAWTWVKSRVKVGSIYIATFSRDVDEDPRRLVVGKPGFAHSQASCLNYFVDIDEVSL